jgi:hypothetical protein
LLSVVVTTSVHVEPHTPFWQVSPAPHATGLPHWPHASHVTVPVLLLLHCTWLLMKQTAGFGHEHAPHWQLWLHVSDPYVLHAVGLIVPGMHTPWPEHPDHADHWPVELSQVRVAVPQLSHVSVDDPGHVCPRHAPHWQLPPHVSVPLF